MTDSRKRRGAKPTGQRPRSSWKRQPTDAADDDFLMTTVRKALSKHPVHLLSLVSLFMSVARPEPDPSAHSAEVKPTLEAAITILSERKCRETTALLAVFAALLFDDDLLQQRCREEVSKRADRLPKWIVDLPHVEVDRVLRRTDVLGDGDELVIGLRLAEGTPLTLGVYLDHIGLSAVTDLVVLPHPLDKALAFARENSPSGTAFVEMNPAEARAWVEHGIGWAKYVSPSKEWRNGLPMVRWLLAQLPGGGTAYEGPQWEEAAISELLEGFFASAAGAPFAAPDYRDFLRELCDTGCGDPSRWSVDRLSLILRHPSHDQHVPLEVALDAPALLRAFIPFAHVRSKVGQDLTDEAIAMIDETGRRYKRDLLADASEYFDDFDQPWRPHPNVAS